MGQNNYIWEEMETVINKYSSTLYKIAYSYTSNKEDAEDVLQEVFIKYAKQSFFKDEEHKKAWLIRVTINYGINVAKSSHRRKTVPLDGMENQIKSNSVNEENQTELKTIVMNLPTKYRAAIYLYYYEGYKVEEIARILNKRPASVYTLLNRGRELIRKILEGGVNDE